jgi:hypothetical protein
MMSPRVSAMWARSRFVDQRRGAAERDQRSRRVAGVDGERDAARYAVRGGIPEESVGPRILSALTRLIPDERQAAFERTEHPRIAFDVRLLIVALHPFARQRREHVDSLAVARPQSGSSPSRT